MERETIIYKGRKYHRYPKSDRRQARVYFHTHESYKSPFPLHRQLWIDNFGKIPKKMVVHHKDENPLNNELSNLELMSKSKHSSLHTSKPEHIELVRKNLKLAQAKAPEWHASLDGRKWHSEHGRKIWKKRRQSIKTCELCGKQYKTYWSKTARFCNRGCKSKGRRLRFRSRKRT